MTGCNCPPADQQRYPAVTNWSARPGWPVPAGFRCRCVSSRSMPALVCPGLGRTGGAPAPEHPVAAAGWQAVAAAAPAPVTASACPCRPNGDRTAPTRRGGAASDRAMGGWSPGGAWPGAGPGLPADPVAGAGLFVHEAVLARPAGAWLALEHPARGTLGLPSWWVWAPTCCWHVVWRTCAAAAVDCLHRAGSDPAALPALAIAGGGALLLNDRVVIVMLRSSSRRWCRVDVLAAGAVRHAAVAPAVPGHG